MYFFVSLLAIISLNILFKGNVREGVLVFWGYFWGEAHGIIIDLLVFGILLSVYEERRRRIDLKLKYLHELADYEDWRENEAVYRTTGIIRRLNHELNFSEIPLSNYYLKGAKLIGLNLSGARLIGTDLSETIIYDTDFSGAYFWEDTKLDNAFVDDPKWFDTLRKGGAQGIGQLRSMYTIEQKSEKTYGGDTLYRIRKKQNKLPPTRTFST
jgi:hypothetical protein